MKRFLSNNELSVFAGQLSMILHAGISSLEGISILRDDTPDKEGKEILTGIYDSLELTGDLADALKESGVFPPYFIKMTEIAERSGTLEEVMASLSDYYERQESLTKSIRDAIVYPLVMLGMLFAVLFVLMTQVMPVFRRVFDQLGMEMSGTSSMIFKLSTVMQYLAIFLLILVAVTVVYSMISLRTDQGRKKLIKLAMYLPVGKRVSRLLACSRFADALSLSLHSGLDMGESFELAAGLDHPDFFREQIKKATVLMEETASLGEALSESEIITGLNARMLSVSFHTGTAETALKQIAVSCQEEADHHIQSAASVLEPALTAVLSILTGLILISVMLPLLSAMSNIG